MTKKNAKKDAARARQEEQGGHYQHHLRQEGGAAGRSDRAIEVLVFDPSGRHYHGIVWFVPPGLPNGAIDPTGGLIMGGIPTLRAGPYMLVEASGRARHIIAERSAGGGAFMVAFGGPDTFMAMQVVYASNEIGEDGIPTTYERYKVILDRKRPEAGVYAMGILPLTQEATVAGVRVFGWQAWRELFALLDRAHPETERRVTIEPASGRDVRDMSPSEMVEALMDAERERRRPGPHHEEDCPLREGSTGECECIGPIEDYSSEGLVSHD